MLKKSDKRACDLMTDNRNFTPQPQRTSILIFLNHQLSDEILSGGEKMFLEVSKRFNRFGINTYAVVPEIAVDSLRREDYQNPLFTIPCFKFEYNSYREATKDMLLVMFVYIYRSIYSCLSIFKWLKESQAQVIYSTGDFVPDTIPAVFAKLFRKKVKWIVLIHHLIESPFKRKSWSLLSNMVSFLMQRFSFTLVKHFADGVFVKNRGVKDSLLRMGFKNKCLFIMDNGIDLDKISSMPSQYPKPFDACYVGRLSASKGVLDLIQIWGKVVKHIPDARLAIIGGGSPKLEETKRNMVRRMNLGKNVEVLGSLPNEEAYRIRKTSAIFLSCSYEEGWGITVAESLACGIPCIAYDLPVYSEKFGKAVELVPKGDLDGFARATVDILNDHEKRKTMASYGKEIAKKYDINQIVSKEVAAIKSICLGV